jgi:hypothetical protein
MRFAVGIIGLLCGVALGAALLLLNPVTLLQPSLPPLAGSVQSLTWENGRAHGMAMTARAVLGIDMGDAATSAFADPGIRYARVEVAALSGEVGMGPALAVRFSAIARQNSLLRARFGMTTYTNIIWPGSGSLFLAGSENLWAPVRDRLWLAARGRGLPPGAQYRLPPVPGATVGQTITGASGRYAGASGEYRESLEPLPERRGDLAGRRHLKISAE